jgi:hypothetical protein
LQYCTLAYDDEQKAREDYDRVANKSRITGEISLRRHEERWFLEIGAERDLGDAFFSRLSGERL